MRTVVEPKTGRNLLHKAIFFGQLEILTFLLLDLPYIDHSSEQKWLLEKTLNGSTALHLAATTTITTEERKCTVISLLLLIMEGSKDKQSWMDSLDQWGCTALHNAAFKNHLMVFKHLLKNGANIFVEGMSDYKTKYVICILCHSELFAVIQTSARS